MLSQKRSTLVDTSLYDYSNTSKTLCKKPLLTVSLFCNSSDWILKKFLPYVRSPFTNFFCKTGSHSITEWCKSNGWRLRQPKTSDIATNQTNHRRLRSVKEQLWSSRHIIRSLDQYPPQALTVSHQVFRKFYSFFKVYVRT